MESKSQGEGMIRVSINGSVTPLNLSGIGRVTDLIELIKAVIDPEHMISQILFNGRELADHEWGGGLAQMGEGIIEIETSLPQDYALVRLKNAPNIVNTCYLQFRESRKYFQEGNLKQGNRALVESVGTLKEFFNWYCTLIELLPAEKKAILDLSKNMNQIAEVCKTICQHQLYQSWWALGESIKQDLEPQLDNLEDSVRKAVTAAQI
jgi:hypothetical protein